MDLLVDTHCLLWIGTDPKRMSAAATAALQDPDARIFVSAVTEFEYRDLHQRGRFGIDAPLDGILDALSAEILDFPAPAAKVADTLTDIHRDPADRMLVAHAIHTGITLVTADADIRKYPVRTLW